MPDPAYRIHQIANTPTHRAHSIQCITDSGIAIALAATLDGEDFGLAVCARSAETGAWSVRDVIQIAEPTVRDINDPGRFVGWSLRDGRERALVGQTDPLQINVSSAHSGATAIDATGRYVGFRRARGNTCAFLHDGITTIDLAPPSSVGVLGCYAASIAANRIFGGAFDTSGILVWDESGELVDRIDVDFGRLIQVNFAGSILCSYGIVINGEHLWLPNAPRCNDFNAASINRSGCVVGYGRALDGAAGHACLWRPDGKSYNLNDALAGPSRHLVQASAISDGGWIACSDGDGNPVLLEPLTGR